MTHNDGNHGDGNHGDGNHGDGNHGDGNHGDGNHGDGNQGDSNDGEDSQTNNRQNDPRQTPPPGETCDAPADFALHYLRRGPPAGVEETRLDILKHMNPVLTALYIAKAYGAHAGEETLMRALICERQAHHTNARFWMDIYERLVD